MMGMRWQSRFDELDAPPVEHFGVTAERDQDRAAAMLGDADGRDR